MPTDVLIGSYPSLPAQTLTISTAGPIAEDHDVAAGDYYLYDDGSSFDLLAAIATAINAHSIVTGATVEILDNLLVRIASATSFALTWPTDGVLRDLLGFTGNLTTATSHTATNISPLLWSPGKRASTAARFGADGTPVVDAAWAQAGPGRVYATSHNEYRKQTLSWRYLLNARVWTTSEENGEFIAFWRNVLIKARPFKVWRNLTEGSGSSWDIADDGDGVLPSTGAYVYQPGGRPSEMPWAREFRLSETLHPIDIPCSTTPEFT